MGWVVRFLFSCVMPLLTSYVTSTPFAIVDAEGRVMTMLAGRPNGAKDWDGVHARMSELLEKAAKKVKVPCGDRRGQFTPLTTGVSHGNGRTVRICCRVTKTPG